MAGRLCFLNGNTYRYYSRRDPGLLGCHHPTQGRIASRRKIPAPGPTRNFWRAALALLIIADRAFDDLGFKEVHYNPFYRFSGRATYEDPDEENPGIDSTQAINGDAKHVRYSQSDGIRSAFLSIPTSSGFCRNHARRQVG